MRKPERINYEFDMVLGDTLKQKRINKGYSLFDIAKKLKITRQAVFRYEKAEISIKKLTFKKYCLALGEDPVSVYEEVSLKYMRYVDSHKNEIIERK